jgi:hypothetical protein
VKREKRRWLLLILQVPSRPAYLRVKISRRLQKIGAVSLKSTVYVLPAGDEAREAFQWIAQEAMRAGGEAAIGEVRFVGGIDDGEVEQIFQAARRADIEAIVAAATQLLGRTKARKGQQLVPRAAIKALERQLTAVRAIDFFGAPEAAAAARLIERLKAGPTDSGSLPASHTWRRADFRGRTWVTRRGIHVDRIASAWLIKRFVDPSASFRFVDARAYRPASGEVRFDMFEAELTHEGSCCTFEVIAQRFRLDAPGLSVVAEIVHDIDLKDGRYGRPETEGVSALIAGICQDAVGDEDRLARGCVIFDGLLAAAVRRRQRAGGAP